MLQAGAPIDQGGIALDVERKAIIKYLYTYINTNIV